MTRVENNMLNLLLSDFLQNVVAEIDNRQRYGNRLLIITRVSAVTTCYRKSSQSRKYCHSDVSQVADSITCSSAVIGYDACVRSAAIVMKCVT